VCHVILSAELYLIPGSQMPGIELILICV
jgi:hypothetical protein